MDTESSVCNEFTVGRAVEVHFEIVSIESGTTRVSVPLEDDTSKSLPR